MEAATDSTTQQAKASVADAASRAGDGLHEAAGQAREQAANATDEAKGRVRGQVDDRINQFAERAGGTAGDLRSIGDELRSRGKDQPANLADQIADRVEQAADYFRDNGADRVLHDLEDFGRKRSGAVIAAGLAAGFLASRMLKASSVERYSQRSAWDTPTPAPSPSTTWGTPGSERPAAETNTPSNWGSRGVTGNGSAEQAPVSPYTAPGATPTPLDDLSDATTRNRDREAGLGSDGLS